MNYFYTHRKSGRGKQWLTFNPQQTRSDAFGQGELLGKADGLLNKKKSQTENLHLSAVKSGFSEQWLSNQPVTCKISIIHFVRASIFTDYANWRIIITIAEKMQKMLVVHDMNFSSTSTNLLPLTSFLMRATKTARILEGTLSAQRRGLKKTNQMRL